MNVKLKWYDIRRLELTGEYCAGIIGGFGLGILCMGALDSHLSRPGWSLKLIVGLALIPIGSSWQRCLTRRKKELG
jgi:hypothetical protein